MQSPLADTSRDELSDPSTDHPRCAVKIVLRHVRRCNEDFAFPTVHLIGASLEHSTRPKNVATTTFSSLQKENQTQ